MRFSKFLLVSVPACALALAIEIVAGGSLQAQGKTVADGVYTDAQADRGEAAYATACGGCHRPDLGGATGPALKEARFSRDYADKDLSVLYTKIATTMPRNAPGSLGDNGSLDVVAHILRENGFPAGKSELTTEGLAGVKLLPGKPKPPPPVGNFSYIETAGCLTQGPGDTWLLTNASAPKSVSAPANGVLKGPEDLPSGTETFRLLDAMAYDPMTHKGQKMYVRGILVKVPAEQRITISTFEMLAPSCAR